MKSKKLEKDNHAKTQQKVDATELVSTKIPKPTIKDVGVAGLRGLLQLAPGGSSLIEVLNLIWELPVQKRRDEWLENLATGILYLEQEFNDFKVETLPQNEVFVSNITQAVFIAQRTHQQEKLEALHNAVLNSAINLAPDENIQLMFLNFIDRFGPWHIRILKLLCDQEKLFGVIGKDNNATSGLPYLERVIETIFPELQGESDYYRQVAKDLSDSGLVQANLTTINQDFMRDYDRWWRATNENSMVTNFGKKFLDYILSPLDKNQK